MRDDPWSLGPAETEREIYAAENPMIPYPEWLERENARMRGAARALKNCETFRYPLSQAEADAVVVLEEAGDR